VSYHFSEGGLKVVSGGVEGVKILDAESWEVESELDIPPNSTLSSLRSNQPPLNLKMNYCDMCMVG